MPKITVVFWDVGGVLLTNGWDRESRRAVAAQFRLEWEDFEDRHELLSTAFETGRLGFDDYLDRTIFYRPRTFSRQEVKEAIFAQSHSFPETLKLVERLARTRKYFLGTINNESLELNLHRIERFGLRDYFSVFFSSCFLGVKKPDEAIYKLALKITQAPAQECVFIDDRKLNLECAGLQGMQIILFQNAQQLETDLRALGAEF